MSGNEPQRRDLTELDHRYLWHPFTPMDEWRSAEPLIVESGRGALLRDVDGREYLDGNSSLWCCSLGHRRPEIDNAIRSQLGRIAHSTLLGLASEPSIRLAEQLVRISPDGLNKVFYSDDGATAAEVAAKMAYQYWRQNGHPERRVFVAIENGYHGDTLGAVSLGGVDRFHGVYRDLLFDVEQVPSPYCYRCPLHQQKATCRLACLRAAEEVIESVGGELAAVFVEPMVQAAGGIIVMPDGYLRGLAAACSKAGGFLVADEVATGFGRTGRMFACDWEDVRPDMMMLGKALTGGYLPVAATLTTDEVYGGFLAPGHVFCHGHTFTGNALGCSAALGALEAMRNDNIPESLPPKVEKMAAHLRAISSLPNVGHVRHLGMIAGVELVRDRETKEPFDPALRVGQRVCKAMLPRGVILRPLVDTLVILPPLTIEIHQLDHLMTVIREVTAEETAAL